MMMSPRAERGTEDPSREKSCDVQYTQQGSWNTIEPVFVASTLQSVHVTRASPAGSACVCSRNGQCLGDMRPLSMGARVFPVKIFVLCRRKSWTMQCIKFCYRAWYRAASSEGIAGHRRSGQREIGVVLAQCSRAVCTGQITLAGHVWARQFPGPSSSSSMCIIREVLCLARMHSAGMDGQERSSTAPIDRLLSSS
jgi:hypothetical protein